MLFLTLQMHHIIYPLRKTIVIEHFLIHDIIYMNHAILWSLKFITTQEQFLSNHICRESWIGWDMVSDYILIKWKHLSSYKPILWRWVRPKMSGPKDFTLRIIPKWLKQNIMKILILTNYQQTRSPDDCSN